MTAPATGPSCPTRFRALRRPTREVRVGIVPVGGGHPVVVQSMTTTPTQDVEATVRQAIQLAEAGCQLVRVTAPNLAAAQALRDIRRRFSEAGFRDVPLVADIHFLPATAMESVEHVEKVRVNPGNFADKKKFAQRDYTDAEYAEELERLHEAFSPLVVRAKELGRALRIGTNHGSLSDRIMNRYGDTPEGMTESALEFLRIAESHGFRDCIVSMKASNPKVMIEAYRIVAARMAAEGMAYPLHLGVTEAGDGEDARIKSALGIGTLLAEGLGDTIRVSLTEDPVFELPVARDLARKAELLWAANAEEASRRGAEPARWLEPAPSPASLGRSHDAVDPFHYARRACSRLELADRWTAGPGEVPRVLLNPGMRLGDTAALPTLLAQLAARFKDAPVEGIVLRLESIADLGSLPALGAALAPTSVGLVVLDPSPGVPLPLAAAQLRDPSPAAAALVVRPAALDARQLDSVLRTAADRELRLVLDVDPAQVGAVACAARALPVAPLLTCTATRPGLTGLGTLRLLVDEADRAGLRAPLWLRMTPALAIDPKDWFGDRLLEAAILVGGCLADGLGDIVSVETEKDPARALTLAYNVLQAARTRSTKTEYVACPSCGRTLFDLQTTTQRIRERTGHLKGVTIAVMGCIVNGPGEMADADFGYVGGAPGKVNLYVGKNPVEFNIPTDKAVDKLVDLIRTHGKWVDPA